MRTRVWGWKNSEERQRLQKALVRVLARSYGIFSRDGTAKYQEWKDGSKINYNKYPINITNIPHLESYCS